jgi:hypothetical protein
MVTSTAQLPHRGLASWWLAWRDFRERLAPRCGYSGCIYAESSWRRLRRRSRGTRMQGKWYCRPECLEPMLGDNFRRARVLPRSGAVLSHRVPLGLLMLSREQLTAIQLRMALDAQKAAGQGKIGEWLQELGFATELQVTAALARQWSCPVLRNSAEALSAGGFPDVPLRLLETFRMIPVQFVESTRTLVMAFSEGIDYTVLYAVEQMLRCHTVPCLVCPSVLQLSLRALAQRRGERDVVFERTAEGSECAHIIGNYTAKVRAEEVRLARCGEYFWVRLERLRQASVNLVLHAPADNLSVLTSNSSKRAASAMSSLV